jgi:hypothetical protein
VRLDHARVVYESDTTETFELCEYHCPSCFALGDVYRGRLRGHDGAALTDTLDHRLPPGAAGLGRP